MAVRLDRAPDTSEVYDLLAEILATYHGDLLDTKAKLGIQFAFAESDAEGEPDAPVKWRGLPAAAKVEKTNVEKRIWGFPDAVLTIDGAQWKTLTDGEQEALLDECLAYLEVARDKDGAFKSDDLGRPVLKVGLPDFCLMGHTRVLERRGGDALSAQAFSKTLTEHPQMKQLLLDFSLPGVESGYGVGRN